MKIVIRWNNTYDNGLGYRTTVVKSEKPKTSAELIVGWLTAHGRTLDEIIIHDIVVDNFDQKIRGRKTTQNLTPEQLSERGRKGALASAKVRAAKKKLKESEV